MKKKILIILAITTLIFLAAGVYIMVNIERTTSALDTLIKLHQVEILRERLLIRPFLLTCSVITEFSF